ncbi:MAG: lysine--tRNA ligase, partial [Deltaproteobacteria bacterium]|nr:lysine--tRNA ligase [Deltaproteobacteria bacterium]
MKSPDRPNIADWNEQIEVRFEKTKKMRDAGLNPFRNGFTPGNTTAELHQKFGEHAKEALEAANHQVSVAGRVMAIRDFGKG